MANIRQVKDDTNQVFYPQTHEKAVVDSNGVNLQTKLANITAPSYVIAWDGTSTPVVANIPANVVVTYDSTTYEGTLVPSASTMGKLYLVYDNNGHYDQYITQLDGSTYSWLFYGNTELDLDGYATMDDLDELDQKLYNREDDEVTKTTVKVDGSTVACVIRNTADDIKTSSNSNDRVYYIPVEEGQKVRLVCAGGTASYIRYGFTSVLPTIDVSVTNVVRYSSTKNVDDIVTAPYDGYFAVTRNTGYYTQTFKTYYVTETLAWEDKADKATTLAGYEISDAYTKTEVDALLDDEKSDVLLIAIDSTTVNISEMSTVDRWIMDTGKWNTNTNYRSCFVPVSEGQLMKVKANNNLATRYAFLTDTTASSGGTPAYITGETGAHIVSAGTTAFFNIPNGCNYVCLYLGSIANSLPNTPSSVIIFYRGGASTNIAFHNYDLALAAKKRMLTETEQQNAGMTASAHNNNCTSLMQIVHISDVHGDWPRSSRAIRAATQLGASIVDSGDVILGTHTSTVEASDYETYKTDMLEFDGDYVYCIGNHDCWTFHSEESLNTTFIAPFATQFGWTVPSGASYFYKDDATNKIRYISVNAWYPYNASSQGKNYGQAQITWFISTLSSVPSGYGVIVVMHNADRTPTVSDGYTKFFQQTMFRAYSDSSISPISTIVDAWISKTALSTTMTDGDGSTLTISADFSSVASNEFICYMTGHTHRDAIYYATNVTNKQLVCAVTTTNSNYNSSGNNLSESSDLARIQNSELQDAFNVYTIDRVKKWVKVVRIGSDMPFDFSERRDCMTIPYAD